MPAHGAGQGERGLRLRSLLFVPGDRPDRFAKAVESGAHAVILDLEDSVTPGRKSVARQAVAEFLASPRACTVLVRINPAHTPDCDEDLAAILDRAPDGIVLPKAEGAASVRALFEKGNLGGAGVLPIATETPAALFELGTYREVGADLLGLGWGVEDLSAAIGASTVREPDGGFAGPYRTVRSLALFAAHAAGVPAIETVYPDIKDLDGLAAYAARGRRDGFGGMLAIHPRQVPVINDAFAPSAAELERARAVVAAFAAAPDAGALQLDGRMIDRPHFLLAQRLLAIKTEK